MHLTGTETYGTIDWEYLHDEHGHVKITGYTSATEVTADVHEDQYGNSRLPDSAVGSGNANTRWSLGAFDGDQGFPALWRSMRNVCTLLALMGSHRPSLALRQPTLRT